MLTGRFTGLWWPSTGNLERAVAGTLDLAEDRHPRVETIGTIADLGPGGLLSISFGRRKHYGLVWGRLTDGRAVTLLDVLEEVRQAHLEDPDTAQTVLTASSALIGAHVDAEMAYPRIHLRLSNLIDWMDGPAIPRERIVADGRIVGFSHRWERSDPIRIPVERGELRLGLNGREVGNPLREATVLQEAAAVVDAEPMTLKDWRRAWVKPLTDLLTFATGRAAAVDYMGLERDGDNASEIEVVWRRPGPDGDRVLMPDELLFNVKDLQGAGRLGSWLTLCATKQDILNLFLGTRYATRMYEENRFLNLVQALEALDRSQYGERPVPTPADEARRMAVLDACPEAHRPWLERQIAYAGRYSLRQRLQRALDDHPWLIKDALPSRGRFVELVSAARNLHSHWDRDTAVGAPEGSDLWILNESLVVILEACLLKEVGFDEADVERLVHAGSGAYRAIRLNQEVVKVVYSRK